MTNKLWIYQSEVAVHLRSVADLTPGLRLARPIRASNGRLLLNAGVLLSAEYLVQLIRLGIPSAYVADNFFDAELPPAVVRAARTEFSAAAAEALGSAKLSASFKAGAARRTVSQMIEEILRHRDSVVALVDVRSVEDGVLAHSANVAVLSLLTGLQLGLGRQQLFELGMGALLHDVGKVRIPPGILDKPGRLTETEYDLIKTHSQEGFDILRQSREVSLLSAHVAFQHHERQDGSGYPRKLKGQEIHLFGAICGVADVFDAMTEPRPYRGPIHPAETLEWIRQQSGPGFPEQVVRSFLRVVAPYPIATLVELSTGDIAIVRNVPRADLNRPLVILVRRSDGQLYPESTELDLAERPDVSIRRALPAGEQIVGP